MDAKINSAWSNKGLADKLEPLLNLYEHTRFRADHWLPSAGTIEAVARAVNNKDNNAFKKALEAFCRERFDEIKKSFEHRYGH